MISWSVLFALVFTLIPLGLAQERALPVRIAEIKGRAYVFERSGGPLFVGAPMMLLRQGHFVATDGRSTALLDLTTNGVIALGPRTIVRIGPRTRRGLRHIDLIEGHLYFRTRPEFNDRPPAGLITMRGHPYGFVGKDFKITYTKNERSIEVLSGQVERFPLKEKKRTQSEDSALGVDTTDEWSDWEEETTQLEQLEDIRRVPPEELQSLFVEQLKTQVEGPTRDEPFSVTIEKKPVTGKFIARGIYNIEDSTLNVDETVTVVNNGNQIDEVSVNDIRQFNPPTIAYDARLELKTDREIGGARLFASGWLEYGKPTDNYRPPLQIFNNRKEGRGPIELNELYIAHNWLDTDLSVGKRVYKTGTGLLISPMDAITPKDLYDPLDYKDLGNWMIRVDHYFGNSSLSYALIPYFLNNKSGVTFVAAIEEALVEPEQVFPRGDQQSFTHYLQYKTILSGWDLIFAAKYGPNIYPIYTQEIDTQTETVDTFKEHKNIFNAMAAFSTTFGPFNFYGEFIYQKASSKDDDTFQHRHLGLKYRNTEFANLLGLDYIDLFGEYSQESIIDPQDAIEGITPEDLVDNPQSFENGRFNIQSSVNWRTHRKNALVRLVLQFNDDFNLNFNGDFNFIDGSFLRVIGADYRLSEGLSLRFNYESYSLDLERSSKDSRILPFDLEIENQSNQSANRTFDRYTLRLEYLF